MSVKLKAQIGFKMDVSVAGENVQVLPRPSLRAQQRHDRHDQGAARTLNASKVILIQLDSSPNRIGTPNSSFFDNLSSLSSRVVSQLYHNQGSLPCSGSGLLEVLVLIEMPVHSFTIAKHCFKWSAPGCKTKNQPFSRSWEVTRGRTCTKLA